MPDTLAGREIVVVGGAGGIGSAVSALLAAEGARLVVSYYRHRERAAKWSDRATVIQADITRAEDRARLLAAAPALYGLVVLAGDPVRISGPERLQEAIERASAVNYAGPILLAREAVGRMQAAGTQGAIVLTGTMQAIAQFPGTTPYAGAKAALVHAARILARELRAPANIRVNVVSPGVTAAGMAEASIASGKYDRYLAEHAIARFGRAEDVARAVRFFLEPDNYVTGQVLAVDGGITL